MKEPRTKAEALGLIADLERRATNCDQLASWQRSRHKREHEETAAQHFRSRAARLHALLPSLPD